MQSHGTVMIEIGRIGQHEKLSLFLSLSLSLSACVFLRSRACVCDKIYTGVRKCGLLSLQLLLDYY